VNICADGLLVGVILNDVERP